MAPHLSEMLHIVIIIKSLVWSGVVPLCCGCQTGTFQEQGGQRGPKMRARLSHYMDRWIDRCTERLIAMEQIQYTAAALMHMEERLTSV